MSRKLAPFERLRLELSLWYAGVFAAILLAFGASTYAYLAVALTQGVDDLNRVALAAVMESVAVDDDRVSVASDEFQHEAAEVKAAYRVRVIRVSLVDGRVLAHLGQDASAIGPAGPERETWRSGPDALRLLRHPISAGGRTLGTVVIGRPLSERDDALEDLAHALLVAIPGAVAVTLLAGAILAGKALRPIKTSFEQQRQFIADASHELRTPVAVILAQSEVGQQGDLDDAHRALGAIERTARRMGGLVADLLLLIRADAASLALDAKHFYLDELAEQVVTDMKPLAVERGLDLRVLVGDPDLAVVADPEKLEQLLIALVDNAVTYTPSPGTVTVRVGRGPTGQSVELAVTDTGIGIPAEAVPRVFDRFFRVDPSRATGGHGSGLGLAIARAIARAHGGDITVESTPGRGTTFRCRLPLGEGTSPS